MQEISNILKCEVRWQYFATSHGKGVVDGTGGAAKSAVRRRVLSKCGPVVQCASDFVREVSKDLVRVQVCEVREEEIMMNKCKWTDVESVPGIQNVHCMSYKDGIANLYSSNTEFTTGGGKIAQVHLMNGQTAPVQDMQTGEWVVVQYDRKNYPGEVTSVVGSDIEVSVMHHTFNGLWKWPENPDKIYYTQSSIVKKIFPPIPVGSRGQFKFNEAF